MAPETTAHGIVDFLLFQSLARMVIIGEGGRLFCRSSNST